MKEQGAVWALNLDGGGSATMWLKDRGVVNRPSDGSERPVTSALLVLPGPDDDQPDLAALPTATPTPGSARSETGSGGWGLDSMLWTLLAACCVGVLGRQVFKRRRAQTPVDDDGSAVSLTSSETQ